MSDEKKISISSKDLITILSMALSRIMAWMPEENISKAICIPDPTDPTKLCAIHNGPEGVTLMIGEGFAGFCEELMCEDCIASLVPYSVIYTGFNLETGEFDPEAYIGLHGAHDEDMMELELKDNKPEVQAADDLFIKRKLN